MTKARIAKPLNSSALGEFTKRMTELGKKGVYIGVPMKSNGRDGGIGNAQIAAIHEFGAPQAGIPERSFLRFTMKKDKDEIKTNMGHALKAVVLNKASVEVAYSKVGAVAAGLVKQTIAGNQVQPPTSQATIQARLKRKKSLSGAKRAALAGSEVTLVDTGALMGSIDYEVKHR